MSTYTLRVGIRDQKDFADCLNFAKELKISSIGLRKKIILVYYMNVIETFHDLNVVWYPLAMVVSV